MKSTLRQLSSYTAAKLARRFTERFYGCEIDKSFHLNRENGINPKVPLQKNEKFFKQTSKARHDAVFETRTTGGDWDESI